MTEIFDDQLILSYFKDFHDKEKADSIFAELCTYPFQPVKLNIYGRQHIPARLCCAFGDEDGLTYSFSGTSIAAQPWTPMLQQIKSEVEALTHEKYNYVLLNKYPTGDAKISAHRDDESSLDPSYCIPTLSYGATRVMHFTRENYMTHILSLEHGSLLVMKPPTNVIWKHGIPSQPEVKTIRISLTFRKLISPQVKRSSDEMDFGYYDDITPKPYMNKRTFLHKKSRLEDNEILEIPQDDWLSRHYQSSRNYDEVINYWSLERMCRLSIVVSRNNNVRIHIQNSAEKNNFNCGSSLEGVSMTPATWYDFMKKLSNFNFKYSEASFIANNQLAVFCTNAQCVLQRIFKSSCGGFRLVADCFELESYQTDKLLDLYSEVTQTIQTALFQNVLPDEIRKRRSKCQQLEHLTSEQCMQKVNNIIYEEYLTSLNEEKATKPKRKLDEVSPVIVHRFTDC
ncbi:Alpha-ketoglutarate-dependent dioxygenase alkB-like protein, partial [Stegodyphus mimosarum]